MKATSIKVCVGRMSVLMANIPRVMATPYTGDKLNIPQPRLASHAALAKLTNEVNSRKPWSKVVQSNLKGKKS